MRVRGNNFTLKSQALVSWFLCIVVVSAVTWQVLRQRELVYRGRPLSRWLAELDSASTPSSAQAMEAIRAMGTNSFPMLQRMLRATDPAWKECLLAFNARQSLMQIPISPASVTRYRAIQGYSALGAAAKPEVASLILMFESEGSPEVRSDIAAALGEIGPEAKPAIPALMKAAQDGNQTLRHSAVFALANIQRWSPSSVQFR